MPRYNRFVSIIHTIIFLAEIDDMLSMTTPGSHEWIAIISRYDDIQAVLASELLVRKPK